MIKIKTKSGFVIEIDENKGKDWRFTKALAQWENDETVLQGLSFCVPFLLGDDGEKALMEHVTQEDGSIPAEMMINEFREILNLLGDKVKKLASSQK
jgi:hypothetical protein